MTPFPRKLLNFRLKTSRTARVAVVASMMLSTVTVIQPQTAIAATEHVVQPGETLSAIADRYGLPVETLLDVNGLSDPNAVQAGFSLTIPTFAGNVGSTSDGSTGTGTPEGRYHTVKDGETLSTVGDLYGVSAGAIADANGLYDLHSVISGATLVIPEPQGDITASVSTTQPETTTDSGVRHVVAAGEVLSWIAESYGVRLESIIAANGLPDPNFVVEGQSLVIPGANQTGPSTGAASSVVHVVGVGETLSSIADRYGVDLSRLADANNLADHDLIVLGERILIPGELTPSQTTGYSGISHVVQLGESLSLLSSNYGVAIEAIIEANGIANPNFVVEGQSLEIPGASGAASAPIVPPPTPALGTHVVSAGETLAAIAASYGVTERAVIDANGLEDPNRIIEGQALAIPGVIPGRQYSTDEYAAILENAAAEFGISASVLKALAWQESGWNQFVVSWAGAVGLMQVMPYTADWALLTLIPEATDWETNPVSNARMGAAILHHWLVRADGDIETALGAYYQGWRSLHEIGMYEETEVYIASVLALIERF